MISFESIGTHRGTIGWVDVICGLAAAADLIDDANDVDGDGKALTNSHCRK